MPKLTHSVPRLCKHTVSGIAYAVVYLSGKQHRCGHWNTRAAKAEYDRLIGEWLYAGRPRRMADPGQHVTVSQLCAAFWKHAKRYYQSATSIHFRTVIRELRKAYGHKPVAEFGPKSLKALRHSFILADSSRSHANQKTRRVKQIFKWGAAEELVPIEVYQRLATVVGLRRGKTEARETDPVMPVPVEDVEATLPYLPKTVADLLRLQLHTGARPGEICALRPMDVNTSADPWEYRPQSHKTAHHGKQRVIFIGPKGQEVLRPYLLRPADRCCFRPVDSETKRRRAAHENRRTPLSCGNVPGTNRKRRPKTNPGEMYVKDALNRAVRRAVDKLNAKREKEGQPALKRWTPNQLRHTAGTLVRREYGLEGAQVILGHSKADVTQIYAERDQRKAKDICKQIG